MQERLSCVVSLSTEALFVDLLLCISSANQVLPSPPTPPLGGRVRGLKLDSPPSANSNRLESHHISFTWWTRVTSLRGGPPPWTRRRWSCFMNKPVTDVFAPRILLPSFLGVFPPAVIETYQQVAAGATAGLNQNGRTRTTNEKHSRVTSAFLVTIVTSVSVASAEVPPLLLLLLCIVGYLCRNNLLILFGYKFIF